MHDDTLSYADQTDVARPVLVLRLVAFAIVAVWISELHVVIRPTAVAWERLWVYATLPMFGFAVTALFVRIPGERIWLALAAVLTITATMLPIGEATDAITVAIAQGGRFGRYMIADQMLQTLHIIVVALSACTMVITAMVLRMRDSRLLRQVALACVAVPVIVVIFTHVVLFPETTTARTWGSTLSTYSLGGCMACLLAMLLPLGRWKKFAAAGVLVMILVLVAVGFESSFRHVSFGWLWHQPRRVAGMFGILALIAAAPLALLLTRRDGKARLSK